DTLYKEATEQEVEQFLNEAFISLSDEYKACNVSKPNRKRIALAIDTLNQMDEIDRGNMLTYINDYCSGKLKFDDDSGCFEISGDEELKLLLYGIEERYYTTRFGNEKRLANSIQKL
ncbi:TPA: ATP F0F1 synthase synthase, partial [Escherichia coli]|nr:ATP F0F1 synthase synthase [Escherichia coli]